MDRAQILALYDRDQRIEVSYPDTRREVVPGKALPRLVRHVSTASDGEGTVIYSRLDEIDVEATIREQVAYFEGAGQNFEWKLYDHDTPPDLKERLAAHGFEIEDAEAIMVLDISQTPEVLLQPMAHSVKRITDPEGIDQVMAVEKAVWGEEDTGLAGYLRRTVADHPQLMSVYVAYGDGKPTSAAWIYFPAGSQFASLWGGSTLSEYRGRGLYTALLAVRLQEARRRGVGFMTVDAGPMSRPILEKYGFERIAYAYACKWRVRNEQERGTPC